MKISAPSGSEVIVTVPNPCGVGLANGSEAAPAVGVADEEGLETGCVSELEVTGVAASGPSSLADETVAAAGATCAAADPALSEE